MKILVLLVAAFALACLPLGWVRHHPAAIKALAAAEVGQKSSVGESAWKSDRLIAAGFPRNLDSLQTRISDVGDETFTGEHRTGWYRPEKRSGIMVSGNPVLAGNRLEIEARLTDGSIVALPFKGDNPNERWVEWSVPLPAGTEALRIHAVDGSTGSEGWMGFSEPFALDWWQTIDLWMVLQTLSTVVLTILLLLGPGAVWRARRRSSFMSMLWLGPLLLASGGMLSWVLGGIAPSALTASVWVVASLTITVWMAWRDRIWLKWSRVEAQVLAVIAVCVLGATANAAFSGGPQGELYGGTISRTLEIGGHSDSRVSFIITQLVAHHLAPNGTVSEESYSPWHFSSRGPLAGLAAAPVVLATGGLPPSSSLGQPWTPFDRYGFATYRIVMITLAALSLIAVTSLLKYIANEQAALIGVSLLALAPFFWHELYFSWPKLITGAWVLAAFQTVLEGKTAKGALWLGSAYLWHPLALLSAPFFGLWLLLRRPAPLWRRFCDASIFGAIVLAVIAVWQLSGGRSENQGGFLQYFWAAGGVYNTSASVWWASRWTSFANTFVPFYVVLFHADHPSFNALGMHSSPLVHFFLQYWTAAPFAIGLVTSCALFPTLVRAIARQPQVAAITLVGPTLFLTLYFGVSSMGMMCEPGHVLFLSGWVFLIWGAGDQFPRWTMSKVFAAMRATEVFLMMFAPTLVNGTWDRLWLLNDLLWGTICALSLVGVIYITQQNKPALIFPLGKD